VIAFSTGRGIIADIELANEFYLLHDRAKEKIPFLKECLSRRGRSLVITEIIYAGGTGVHGAFRAFDIRVWGLSHEQAKEVEKEMNERFPRDDGHPTAFYHNSGGGWHLHIQVAP